MTYCLAEMSASAGKYSLEAAVRARVSSGGFLLLDSSMNPILVDREASEILSYPHKPETQKNLDNFLAGKIGSMLLTQSSSEPALVTGFQSGRRLYQCRAYPVSSPASGTPQASVAIVLERGSKVSDSFMEVSMRFRLTTREQEVVQYLFEGLTTKEIAGRLSISPHTVKAFLRLIMVKMAVSTRSGIVGKALARA